MAYTLTFGLALGTSQTGLTLAAQLVDTAGGNVGGEVTTGFVEMGQGNYTWTYAGIPDGHRGAAKFYKGGVPGTILAIAAINAEEGERLDVAVSSRAVAGDAMTLTGAYEAAKTAAQAGDAMTLTAAERDALNTALGAEGLTLVEALELLLASHAGNLNRSDTGYAFRDLANAVNRIVGTVDSDGNRVVTERNV